jgi:hypothetical protein
VNLSTVPLQDGSILFMIGVAPEQDAREYMNIFNRVRQTMQLADTRR